MALKVSISEDDMPDGDAAPNAYVRIQSLTLNIVPKTATVVVYIHRKQGAATKGKSPAMTRTYTADEAVVNDLTGNLGQGVVGQTLYNVLASRIYAWLKTKPEYSGSTDV